ncbi:hypothetical protein COCMIDRAFT_10081 [Bipolaris oryzae ATCC 44560]|uniref:Uncharacterized protein n=1 Tax=Bipolaris oryzae ATCC 44560 TaxID=930090 RepID=W6YWM5_COCMI|nr:uncharacterized protein COCMIDRAFT_10081 [Bipolaris oryzae ATCC 44560]EUC39924.1 hypothetical protein COCMIDRAFT_10081 [Bipolaris oryzae ATCC 44560]
MQVYLSYLEAEQRVSTWKSITSKSIMEFSSSESTMDSDRPPRPLRSATKNKKRAMTYGCWSRLHEYVGKAAGLDHAESESLSKTVEQQVRQLLKERPGIPWKDYDSNDKDCCLESTETMLRVITKKTVPRDRLEWMISPLIDTLIDAQEEKVKGKKAAAIRVDKKNPGVLPSRSPTAPNSSSAIHSTHFDATSNTKADTDKSHVKAKPYDPVRDL